MSNRRTLRIATALLLAWIGFDLALIDTSALHVDPRAAACGSSIRTLNRQPAPSHPQVVHHGDHCFCSGLSTGADSEATLANPLVGREAVAEAPPGHPRHASAALYHPPQPHA